MRIDNSLHEKEIIKEISERIKQYRIAQNITQSELADKAMISVGTVHRFENGEDIGFLKLISILKVLGLEGNLDLLVTDPTDRPSYHFNNSVSKRERTSRRKKTELQKWGEDE